MVSFYGNAGGEGGGGSGGTTNYNDLTNKPFINMVGTSANPMIIQNLLSGRYLISGYFKHGTDEPSGIAVPAGTKAEIIIGVDTITGYKVAEYNTIENGDIIVNKILYKADGSLDKVEKVNVSTPKTVSMNINDLENVELSNLANGQVLKYNATTKKWNNAEDEKGSSGSGDVINENNRVANNAQVEDLINNLVEL